jgi:hypothetical protein
MLLSVLGTIFGSGKVIDKGMELIDDLHTSDEEAIKAKTQAKIDLLQGYAPFKVTQRYLAVAFVYMFIFIMANGVLGALYGWVDLDNVGKALDFANKMYLGEIVMVIMTFYFGGGFIESWNRKEKK